jgi:anti-anti-sigma factor
VVRRLQLLFSFLQFIPDLIWGTRAINELQRLTVSLRGGFEQRAKCQLFRFTGQLDTYSDKQFVEFLGAHRQHSKPLLIDLTHIDCIDSSGLGALVQLAKHCQDEKQRFLVVGNARVKQTVKLVRLEEFLHLQSDLNTALGSITA